MKKKKMIKTTHLSYSYYHQFLSPPPIIIPNPTTLLLLPTLLHHRDRPTLRIVCKAKTKELILGNPSVTVEKGKYSYDVETLINKLSSLPPRGSIARCLDTFKNKLSLSDFSLVLIHSIVSYIFCYLVFIILLHVFHYY